MEGFYGTPFSAARRRALIGLLSFVPGAAYVYAPKDDPWHRLEWRERYPRRAWAGLAGAMSEARRRGVRFVFGLSPWEFHDDEHRKASEKLRAAVEEGAGGVSLLFDDIEHLPCRRLAERQASFALKAAGQLGIPVMICPSVYCESQAEAPGAADYLEALSALIPREWGVFWTGDDVISRKLDSASLARAEALLGRLPVIWDNLLADDYTIRRVFLGALDERPVGSSDYFLNPSGRFRAAWEQVRALVSAAGAEPPPSPVECPGLKLLKGLHWNPWECGEAGREAISILSSAVGDAEPGDCAARLDEMHTHLEELLELLSGTDGGLELAPQVRDTARLLSIVRRCLAEPPGTRSAALRSLLMERLPYEHPLAEAVRLMACGGGEGSEGGRCWR